MEQKEQLLPEQLSDESPIAEPVEQPAENAVVPEAPIEDNIVAEEAPIESVDEPVVDPAAPVAQPVVAQPEKKPANKKLFIILGGVLAVALVAFLIVYFTVIKPNGIYDDAVAALNRGDYYECERLINQIPDHEKVPALKKDLNLALAQSYIDNGDLDIAENLLASMPGDERAKALRDDINYYRAEDLIEHGEYEEASLLLDKIPDHEDPKQLHEKIDYETALASLEKGDYETAYDLFSSLGDYEDAAQQKDIVYYEALAFKSLFNIQTTLKNPASMRVTKVTFYNNSSTEGELDAVFEFNATNSYGGSLGAYGYDLTLYDGEDDSGMISHSAYVDPDDYYDMLLQSLIDVIRKQEVHETTVDVARMNRLLEGNASFKIDLPFQSGSVVEN